MAKLVGPTGTVHAFEPNPELLRLFDKSLARNNLQNVVLHECALSDVAGELALNVQLGNSGTGTLLDRFADSANSHHLVAVRRLDDENIDFSRVSFMKIDVEGFEAQVLRGFSRVLSSTPPPAIVLERNYVQEDGTLDNGALSVLREAGYSLFGVKKTMLRLQFTPAAHDVFSDHEIHDVLALAPTDTANSLRHVLGL